jgi:hypothetical protein
MIFSHVFFMLFMGLFRCVWVISTLVTHKYTHTQRERERERERERVKLKRKKLFTSISL